MTRPLNVERLPGTLDQTNSGDCYDRQGSRLVGGRRPLFGDIVRACRDLDNGRLKATERAFIEDMRRLGFSYRPTQRQRDWACTILLRLVRDAA